MVTNGSYLGIYLKDVMFLRGRSTFQANIRTTEIFSPDLSFKVAQAFLSFAAHLTRFPNLGHRHRAAAKKIIPLPASILPSQARCVGESSANLEERKGLELRAPEGPARTPGPCPSPRLTPHGLFRHRFRETQIHVADSQRR